MNRKVTNLYYDMAFKMSDKEIHKALEKYELYTKNNKIFLKKKINHNIYIYYSDIYSPYIYRRSSGISIADFEIENHLNKVTFNDIINYRRIIKEKTSRKFHLKIIKKYLINTFGDDFIDINITGDTIFFTIYYPKIDISNSLGIYHTMYDLYLYGYIAIQYNNSFYIKLEKIKRTTLSIKEIINNYFYSHCSFNLFNNRGSFCFGSDTEIKRFFYKYFDIKEVYNTLFSFKLLLDNYLSWESIEGVPYNYINSLDDIPLSKVSVEEIYNIYPELNNIDYDGILSEIDGLCVDELGNLTEDSINLIKQKVSKSLLKDIDIYTKNDKYYIIQYDELNLFKDIKYIKDHYVPNKVTFKGEEKELNILENDISTAIDNMVNKFKEANKVTTKNLPKFIIDRFNEVINNKYKAFIEEAILNNINLNKYESVL